MAAVIDYLDSIEIGVCLRINRLSRRAGIRQFFSVISQLGDGGLWLAMGFLLVAIQGLAVLDTVLHIALTGGAGVLVYKLLKKRLVRERPFSANSEISCGCAPLDRYSFPSGHTLHAVSFTIMFGSAEPALLVVCLPFAMLVAASRIILGLHYPSDVLVGASIGALLAATSLSLT